jgi:hypothetical protein
VPSRCLVQFASKMLVPVFDYSVSQAGGFLPDAM